MDELTARPGLLKQANLSRIRRAVRVRSTATRAQIAEDTGISSTTVRSLLAEMLENGEMESTGYDESSGGRRAERYCLNRERYFGAAFCITDSAVHCLLVNVCGEILETTRLETPNGDFERTVAEYLDRLAAHHEIRAIGLGVPGVVDGSGFWRKDAADGELHRTEIGEALAERYGVPVLLENDLNATAIGFGRCHEREFPSENPEDANMAYLHFEKDCVSAGFIVGGRIVRGCNNFAGELGLVLAEDGRALDDCMAEPMDDVRYIKQMVRLISWVCGILNPRYVALGGPSLRKHCIGPIGDGLSAYLPQYMMAEILYTPDVWHDYYDGMAVLTAGRMFEEIQFVRE